MEDQKVIVVADDDAQIAGLIAFRLQRLGFIVHVGQNGAEALDLIRSVSPNLVVLDVMMPVMDGFEVLREMKRDSETWDIPAIMLTAREMEEDKLKGFELGAVDYVTKPFSPAELTARIHANLNGHHRLP